MDSLHGGPISDNYYHDCELFGIVSNNSECLLMLRDPERGNRRHDIGLHGVELLYAKNFMQGNIIFDIKCFEVSEENFDQVLGMLQDRSSDYMSHFDTPQYRDGYRKRYVGRKLILLSSSYGASLVCICERVSEMSPA